MILFEVFRYDGYKNKYKGSLKSLFVNISKYYD
jgi:hypothetical protein